MHKLLIIDDEEKLRSLMARILSLEGYEVKEARDVQSAWKMLDKESFEVVLSDVKLPDGNGVELASRIKSRFPLTEVILLTAYGNIPDGVQAIKNGAFDYITKGDDNNKIIPLVARAIEKGQLSARVQQLEKQLGQKFSFDTVLGTSAAIQSAVDLARKVAPTQASVLLTGETGTGKEVFAQSIHQASERRQKNFVAVNCAAFSKELLDSEMFGYVAGAFTGATKDKKGLFEEAHGGTIFLDELGEMPLDLQAKLLRVLESGEYNRVGDSKRMTADVRVIAATNRDLKDSIREGHFRSDLFYRISAFQIELPSLRNRKEDIEVLTWHFARTLAARLVKKVREIRPAFLEALKQHSFPGNIRELKNLVERALILMDGDVLDVDHLPLEMQPSHRFGIPTEGEQASETSLAFAEKEHIRKILLQTKGNKTETARLLHIALTTLYRKLEEYKL